MTMKAKMNNRGLRRFGKSAKKVKDFAAASAPECDGKCRVEVIHECECAFHKLCKSEIDILIHNLESRYVDDNGKLYEPHIGLIIAAVKGGIKEWLAVAPAGAPKANLARALAREIVKPMIRMLDAIEAGERDFEAIKKIAEV